VEVGHEEKTQYFSNPFYSSSSLSSSSSSLSAPSFCISSFSNSSRFSSTLRLSDFFSLIIVLCLIPCLLPFSYSFLPCSFFFMFLAWWRTEVEVGHEEKTQYFSTPFYTSSSSPSSSSSFSLSAPSFCISYFFNSSRFSSSLRLSAFLLPYYCPLSNTLSVTSFLFFPSLLLLLYVSLSLPVFVIFLRLLTLFLCSFSSKSWPAQYTLMVLTLHS
jgi:hypothetical protein